MTPDAKGVCAVPVAGSNKIDTVAAELVPRNRRAASVLNSRRRILREFRNATLGGVRRGVLEALGVDPGEESEGHSERRSTCGRAGPVQPFGWNFQTLCFGLVGPNFGRHPVGRSA